MEDVETKGAEEGPGSPEQGEVTSVIQQEVQEIKEAVSSVVSETSLAERVEALRTSLENVSEEVEGWRTWRKSTYLEVLEALKSQVEDIHGEWDNVSARMKTQSEKLESLLQSFPGVIETSTLKALSLRVSHLEQLISQLFQESNAKSVSIGTRKQLVISLVALGVTVVLWVTFILLNVIG